MITEFFTRLALAPGTPCPNNSFLGFPTWYKYLEGSYDDSSKLCAPHLSGLSDIWLIVAAVIEILLRVAVLVAVVGIIYGGFSYITSQGEPDKTSKARMTIINAAGGMVIAILATVIVSFIAGSIK
jgi:hypothetical protein